jgi:SPP1 family predicted phage head-tail adaptor
VEVRIGDLNKRIILQEPVSVADGMSGFTITWTQVAAVWAAVWPISANETKDAMQTGMTITHRIRIRYRAGIKASWRISWDDRYFNIVSIIDPSSEHAVLDIMCKEAAA